MSGAGVNQVQPDCDGRHDARITGCRKVNPVFPTPLGAEIGRLECAMTTNVIFVIVYISRSL